MGDRTRPSPDIAMVVPCFANLEQAHRQRLARAMRELSYAQNEIVVLEGEPCPGLFVLKSGSVKLYKSTSGGEEHIIRLVRKSGCFECVPFFDGGNNPTSAQTLEPSTLYFLPAKDFNWMIDNSPDLLRTFAPILASRLRSLVNTVGDFSHRRVYPRLARLLCQLAERKGGKMIVSPSTPLHQQHLACMLGCSRQIVNRALGKLAKEGVIRLEKNQIIICDDGKLNTIV